MIKQLIAAAIFMAIAKESDGFEIGIATGDPHPDPFHFGVASGWNQIATIGAVWVRFDVNWNTFEAGNDANGNPIYALQAEKLNFLTLARAAGLKTRVILGANSTKNPAGYANPWDIAGYSMLKPRTKGNQIWVVIPHDPGTPSPTATPSLTPSGPPAPIPTATPAPTPSATPTLLSTPALGINPSVTLPANYKLAWNQDFTSASYSPFNQAGNVSVAGPPASIWFSPNGTALGAFRSKSAGVEGDPFSTSLGYLTIHANGRATPPMEERSTHRPRVGAFHLGQCCPVS